MSLSSSSSSSHIFDTIQHEFPKDIHVGKATRIVGETATQFLLKTTYQSSPFLVQTPKMHIKQKFQKVAGNKGWSTDLVFAVSDSEFYDWFENLEKFCVDYLFQNQKQWFQTDLSTEDIEGLFVSPFRVFKSSKTYQMKCHISDLGQSLAIFDTEQKRVDYNDQYQTDSPLLGIIEVIGIRCSQKHFQIDLELKQILELPTVDKVESCLIRPNSTVEMTLKDPETSIVESSISEPPNEVVEKVEIDTEIEGIDLGIIQEVEVIDLSIIQKRVLEKARMAMDLGVINYLDRKKIGNTQLYLDFSRA